MQLSVERKLPQSIERILPELRECSKVALVPVGQGHLAGITQIMKARGWNEVSLPNESI